MGSFVREGIFRNRERFREALRGTIARLREGALRGMAETWEQAGKEDVVRLSGFGARVEFILGETSWRAAVETPVWLPVSPSVVEAKFDELIAAWRDL